MRALSRRALLAAGGMAFVAKPAWAAAPLLFTAQPLAFMRIEVGGASAVALLDTGGVRGVQISGNLADTLHVNLTAASQVTQRYQNGGIPVRSGITEVTIDDRTWTEEQVSVAAGDIERIAEQIGQSFDAILGWRFLSREGFVADFASGQFTIGGGGGTQAIAFDDSRGVPIGAAQMDGAAIGVLIDTGAPTCAIDASLVPGATSDRVTKTLTLGGRAIEAEFRVRDLSALSNGTGAKAVLGLSAMQGKRLAFDARSRSLTLD